MKYVVKTKHQDGNDYVCVETNSVEAALNYATEATEQKAIALIITNEHDDEMCIVFGGFIYQESCFREVIEYSNEIEEDYE